MELNHQANFDISQVGCPHCSGRRGLELALRVELEAEATLYVAACRSCQRIYRVEPNGRLRFTEIDSDQLKLNLVRCPSCGAVGYAVSLDFLRGEVESYTILTCQDCQFTFRSDVNRQPTLN
jgi:DNA-directed RNA polymerase subunit M/transcription elongation factor TFIIS